MDSRAATEGKASPKRDFRSSRSRSHRSLKNNLLETIAQVNGGSVVSHISEDGVVRMKLLVRKQDLKQMLELMRSSNNSNSYQSSYSTSSSLSVEQRLDLLRRKHLLRANNAMKESRQQHSWIPALQSIPEEL